MPPADSPNSQSWGINRQRPFGQFIGKALRFLWVGGGAETHCKFEKRQLLTHLSLDTVFDQFHWHFGWFLSGDMPRSIVQWN